MGDLLISFPESVRVKTKHVEKTRDGLWGQSTILKAVWEPYTEELKKYIRKRFWRV